MILYTFLYPVRRTTNQKLFPINYVIIQNFGLPILEVKVKLRDISQESFKLKIILKECLVSLGEREFVRSFQQLVFVSSQDSSRHAWLWWTRLQELTH